MDKRCGLPRSAVGRCGVLQEVLTPWSKEPALSRTRVKTTDLSLAGDSNKKPKALTYVSSWRPNGANQKIIRRVVLPKEPDGKRNPTATR